MKRILLSLAGIFALLFILDQWVIESIPSEKAKYKAFIEDHPYSHRDFSPEAHKGLAKHDRPDLAAEHNFLMTVDPALGRVPSERMVVAYEGVKQIIDQRQKFSKAGRSKEGISIFSNGEKEENLAISNVNWTERGPDNVGGRTRALMWDPNDPNTTKVWAGAASGGLWFNNDITDGNSSWFAVDDFLASLSISSITFDPNDKDTYYVGTGEGFIANSSGGGVPGGGLYKSEDAGANWTLLSSTIGPNFRYIQKVVVTQASSILVSTRESLNEGGQPGIYRSTDGGANWTRVITGRSGDIEIASNGDIYANRNFTQSSSIIKSTDDGLTWEDVTPTGGNTPRRIEMAIAPSQSSISNQTVIYAVAQDNNASREVAWLRRSDDGGLTWTDLDIPNYRDQDCSISGQDFTRGQAFYDLILAVKPDDPDVFTLGGINVLRSTDGGSNIEEVSYWTFEGNPCDDYVHADQHEAVFRPGFPNEAIFGHDGGVSYSVDIGSASVPSFDTRNRNYRVTQFYSVTADNVAGSNYFLAGSQDNGTQQFTTGGGQSTDEATGGDGGFTHIDQTDRDFQTTAFTGNTISHSSNGGATFSTIVSTNAGLFINPTDLDDESHILYSAGDNNQLLRLQNVNSASPDEQEVLTVSVGQISRIRANAYEPNRIFVGSNSGDVFRVDNANTNPVVTNISAGITTDGGFVSSIDIGSTDDQLIVTLSNYGISSVWLTTDGGDTWVNKDQAGHGLPDIPIRWAMFNPNNTAQVLLATELGVWSSNNVLADNPGWEPTVNNLANVRCDMLQYREADGFVILATFGRGVYTSDVFSGTTDADPPIVVSLRPATGTEEVFLDVDLEIVFNEPVNSGSGNVEIRRTNDDSLFETIDISTVPFSGAVGLLSPSADLEPSVQYYINIDNGVITDNSGNDFPGISDNSTWTFTTFNGDFPPTVESTIQDVRLIRDFANPVIATVDLSNVFTDQDNDDEAITKQVIDNTNTGLISTDVSGDLLTITAAAGEVGTAIVSVEGNSNGKIVETNFSVVVGDPVLFSQVDNPSTTGLISMQILDRGDAIAQAADDFVVTAGEIWDLTAINVTGRIDGDGDVNSFRIELYENGAGLPTSLTPIYSETVAATFENSQTEIRLPINIESLLPGAYWISVIALSDLDEELWRWVLQTPNTEAELRFVDRSGFFDDIVAGEWLSATQIGIDNSDCSFTLEGVSVIETAPPTGLNAALNEAQIDLTWADNSDNETGFEIQRSVGGVSAFEEIGAVNPGETTFSDVGLTGNTEYFYRVRALADLNSDFSNLDSVLTLPEPPVIGEVEELREAFKLNWSAPDGASEFEVDLSRDNFITFVDEFEAKEVKFFSSVEVPQPESGEYQFRVRSVNETGISENSEVGVFNVIAGLGERISETFKFNTYPNPVENILTLQLPKSLSGAMKVSVTGLDGVRVIESQINSFENEAKLDMSHLKSGMYLITIQNDTELAQSRFMKLF